ncbi:MAG: cytochrome c [Gammaproteobacteria bacterium]|nr:cytochrome c [Gemmatimonadota bacterium]NIR82442.1 cytochrome c [Gammaproteobacteria bacterium]NIU03578.1 cytochrome c [Gammaproteobacteria bacterium]NIX84852.1 cytochrome c [Gammaproteobacteria bacterium]
MNNARFVMAAGIAALLIGVLPTHAAEEEDKPDIAQLTRGSQAWANNCARCHNLRDPAELQDFEWEVSVSHMRVRANLPGEMARDIAAFLKANND